MSSETNMQPSELQHLREQLELVVSAEPNLIALRNQLGRFISHLESEQRMQQEHSQRIEQQDVTLYGDKENQKERPGLVSDVAQIQSFVSTNRKIHYAVLMSILALLIKSFWGTIAK